MDIPVVHTERLLLRGLSEADFEVYARWLADEDTARYIGGQPLSREDAWRSLATMLGHWQLRSYGLWGVVEEASGALVGRVGLWNPEGWPGVEVGWLIAPEQRRRGFAKEAAAAAVRWGFERLEVERIVSVIHVENHASIKVAEAIGERFLEHREVRGFSCGLWGIDAPRDVDSAA